MNGEKLRQGSRARLRMPFLKIAALTFECGDWCWNVAFEKVFRHGSDLLFKHPAIGKSCSSIGSESGPGVARAAISSTMSG